MRNCPFMHSRLRDIKTDLSLSLLRAFSGSEILPGKRQGPTRIISKAGRSA